MEFFKKHKNKKITNQEEMWAEFVEFQLQKDREAESRYLLLVHQYIWVEPNPKELEKVVKEAIKRFPDFPFGLESFQPILGAIKL